MSKKIVDSLCRKLVYGDLETVDPLTRPCNLILYRDLLQKSDMLNGFVEKNEESPWKQVFSRDRVKNFLQRSCQETGELVKGPCTEVF